MWMRLLGGAAEMHACRWRACTFACLGGYWSKRSPIDSKYFIGL